MKKTLKREVAVIALLFWAFVTAYLYLFADLERINVLGSYYIMQTSATFTYAAAAFGMHALATQFGQK